MKKALKIVGALILMLALFRGTVFRFAIKYNEVGSRPGIEVTNSKLIEKIKINTKNREIDLSGILKIADKLTKEELKFTKNRVSNNPNKLIDTNQANCVGYSAMFNSIANYLINKNKYENEIEVEHKIGQLELFGINLHQFFESPFFRDHDYNEITDKNTGKKILVDPVVSDYLRIKRVAQKNKLK